MTARAAGLLLALVACGTPSAAAAEPAPPAGTPASATSPADSAPPAVAADATDWTDFGVRRGTFTLVTENDKFFAGSDRHYTNGLKLTWLNETDLDDSRRFTQRVAELMPWLDPANIKWRYKVGVTLGQNIYTPADTDTSGLITGDRPYAGWLYAGLVFHAQVANQLRLVEVAVGVVGPSALGEQFQNNWHKVIDVAPAQGWSHQLRDEPGLNLSWERRYRLRAWLRSGGGNWSVDTIAHGRLTIGNVQSHLATGATARAGWRLPADFGPDLIRPGGGNTPNADGVAPFTAYLFAHGEVRAVARDIFLDGNTWRDSHSVRKRPVAADLSLGFVVGWPAFQLTYTQVHRTKEFYTQAERDVFGSIGLSWAY